VNCLEFVIILPPVPKVNKLSVPIFWKKKVGFTTYGSIKKNSTEEKCYLMGCGEYGVKSKDIDFRVYLKNIFALEPPLKFAMFVVEEVIYQNVKKKVKKNDPPPL
jgi:hypothetical protein